MRLEFPKQSDAQALADRIHSWMLANDRNYAASVAAGHTTAWCIPYQVVDEAGKVINPAWCVNVKERCLGALTGTERIRANA